MKFCSKKYSVIASSKNFLAAVFVIFSSFAWSRSAETIPVKIINRQDQSAQYAYVVPAYAVANGNSAVNCFGGSTAVNCSGATRASATYSPAHTISYAVQGATFSLQLPDGRIAIVNCASKYAPRGDHINRRSCRTPLIDNIEAEFNGDKAKLKWPVSIDGSRMESETYKVLGVFEKPQP